MSVTLFDRRELLVDLGPEDLSAWLSVANRTC